MNLLNKVANLMLDEFQLNEVKKLCEKYNRTFSDVVRISLRSAAVSFDGQDMPTSYRSIKKGVRLDERDIKVLAYIMKKFDISSISECCRLCLMLLLHNHEKDLN